MRKITETLRNEYLNLRNRVFNEIKNLLVELNNEVEIPYDISEKCYICIAYNGGNHPEYNSNVFSEVEVIVLNKDNDVEVYFTDGAMQELSENSIDDYFTILDLLITIKEEKTK